MMQVSPSARSVAVVCLLLAASPAWAENAVPPAIAIPHGVTIVAEGDSLTYGQDASPAGVPTQINGAPQPRSAAPFPETLAEQLRGCANVVNHGYPGDRSVDGLVRWQSPPHAGLAILMYGSNDALNSARASSGVVSPDTFRSVLGLLIARRKAEKAQIILLSPPPIGNDHQERMIEPFRAVVRDTARELGLPFIDTREVLKGVTPIWTEDKVHLSQAANIAIARSLSRRIACR